MKIRYGFYKDGKKRALTMSYDDGRIHDLRLIEIFDKYGIRGTFHLNSGNIGREGWIAPADIEKYKNHEVSSHTLTHPFAEKISDMELVHEVMADRENLEKLCGYPVRGMSYPYGTWSESILPALRTLGMNYSRTTAATKGFDIPKDFMVWNPTCHHKRECDLAERLESFKKSRGLSLFYIWGHSYELEDNSLWEYIEEFCKSAAGDDTVWYATNIEICDYITALRALQFSADRTMVYNPTATDVWLDVDGQPARVPSGIVTKF